MIQIRKANERGHFNFGWLDTYHTFSFAEYHDDRYMNFRALRVINEDQVAPGQGFGTHPHRDMEIITYILEGELEHKDSMGTGSVIRPGDVQRMSAGTGVTHSEFNHSKSKAVHLLQIWILPAKKGITPSYEQKAFTDAEKKNKLVLVASGQGEKSAVKIHQDVSLYSSKLEKGASVSYELPKGRFAWLQVARGAVALNGQKLSAGDGAAVSEEKSLKIIADNNSEILLFDLF